MSQERPYADRWDENHQTLSLCKSDFDSADCNVGDTGIQKLLTADWSLLRKLDLSNMSAHIGHNKLTDAALEQLAARNWDNLVSLHLEKNEITDKGIAALLKAKFPKLRSLRISNYCPIQTTTKESEMRLLGCFQKPSYPNFPFYG